MSTYLEQQLQIARERVAQLPEWRKRAIEAARQAEIELGYIRQKVIHGAHR